MLYNNLSGYLRKKYGTRVGKICIDGGFSCPNRDGKCGTGGCIFCSERGSGDHIDGAHAIGEQVRAALKKGRHDKYIAYFQNYTNTYADVVTLKERYDSSLVDSGIVALAIGTRPDCIDEDVVRLLSEYKKRVDVWVELGLQTASDRIGEIINRGYTKDVFIKAAQLLNKYSIPFVTHMIIGLPESCADDVYDTAELINVSGAWGVKIHSIYVSRGTRLAQMYENNQYTPPTLEEFVTLAADTIERLRPDITVHRLTGDCPQGMLVAPDWNNDKNKILKLISDTLEKRGTRQGSKYVK